MVGRLNLDDLAGAAPPLVFVHGWCGDRTSLASIAAAFASQQRILVDLLGHGASPPWSDWTIGQQADALLASIPDGSLVVGHSMGAQVAVEAAARGGARIAALVLLDPAPIAPFPAAAAFVHKIAAKLDAADDLPTMMEAFGRGFIRHGVADGQQPAFEAFVAGLRDAPAELARRGWHALCDWDGRIALARVTCPVLMINAEGAMNAPSDMQHINPHVVAAQLVGSGHMVQLEAPAQLIAMIRRFMEILPVSGRS